MKAVLEGSWWVPSAPTNRVIGRLEYTPGESGALTYFGSIDGSQDVFFAPRRFGTVGDTEANAAARVIFGEAIDSGGHSQRVTLLGVLNSKHEYRSHHLTRTRVTVKGILTGVHLDSVETTAFDSLSVQLTGLSEWLGEIPMYVEQNFEKHVLEDMSVRYVHPELPAVNLTKYAARLSFNTGPSFQSESQTRVLRYSPSFQVRFERLVSLDVLIQVAERLHAFLAVATGWPTSVHKIYATSTMTPESPQLLDVTYAANLPWNVDLSDSDDFITSLATLGSTERLERCLNRWLDLCDTYPGPVALLLDSLYRHHENVIRYQDTELLHLVQAAEGMHRRRYGGTNLSEADFGKAVETFNERIAEAKVFRGLPVKFRAAVRRTLNMANEYTLEKRLKELMAEVVRTSAVFIRDKATFPKEVADARNTYAHRLLRKGPGGRDLLSLNLQLRCLIIACMLREVGFVDEELEVGFRSYAPMRLLRNLGSAGTAEPRDGASA